MLEVLRSRSDEPICKLNGKLLASRVNPTVEGDKWVERHRDVIELSPVVIVLGLGCGYHVISMRRTFPGKQILVIEPSIEVVNFCKKSQALPLASVDILNLTTVAEVRCSSNLKSAMRRPYAILRNKPSFETDKSFLERVEGLLIGREDEGFQFLLEVRPELKPLLADGSKTTKLQIQRDHQLSIKSLDKMISEPTVASVEPYMIIKALNELVK